MYVDSQLLFSDAQAVTAAADSTNIVDLGAAGRDIGTGEGLTICVVIDVAMTDAGSDSAITVALQGDSTSTITPDATVNLGVIPAVSAAGARFYFPLAPGSAPLALQYINLKYTPSNGSLSTGSFTSFLAKDIQKENVFPDAITIS